MNAEEMLKTMFRSFFIIATGIVTAMYVFCLLYHPDAKFTLRDIGGILLLALFSDLPFLIFYSRNELSKKQMYVRNFLHLPVLLAVVLYFAYLWDWISINQTKEVIVFILLVLAVYAVVFAITVYYDKKMADKLNQSLRERYRSK